MSVYYLQSSRKRTGVEPAKLVEAAAFFLVVLAVWFISEVNILGQYCMLAAQIFWLIIGVKRSMWALTLQSLVLFGLTSRAIYLWYLA